MDGPLKSLKLYFEKGKIGYDTSYVHLVSVPLKMGSDIYKKEKHIESAFAKSNAAMTEIHTTYCMFYRTSYLFLTLWN